jgi:hypothetical protein
MSTTTVAAPNASKDRQLRILNEMMEQYERQSAIEAHTVYRVNGKPICVVARNGQTLFDTVDDFRSGGGLKPSDDAGRMGLTGEQYMEYISRQIADHLRRRYASALQVARYEEGEAPVMGELREEMFGITRERWRAIALSAAMGLGEVDLPNGILVLAKN